MIVDAKINHVTCVCNGMDDASKSKASALGVNPKSRMRAYLAQSSWSKAWIKDGKCLAVGGVTGTSLSSDGTIWLAVTKDAAKFPREALSNAFDAIDELMRTFRRLDAIIDANNRRDIRFAEYLGFDLGEPEMIEGILMRRAALRMEPTVIHQDKSSIVVRKVSVSEVESSPNFPMLAKEYAEDAAIAGLPPPVEKLAMYYNLQKGGMFQAFGAFWDGSLIGFVAVITPVIPHYGVTIAVIESLFVGRAYRRKTGAGLRLLRAAEAHSRAAGSPALTASAPTGGRLNSVLLRRGYREVSRSFVKDLR